MTNQPYFQDTPVDEPPDYLYQYHELVTEGVRGLGGVTPEHIQQFREQGYLVVEQAFSADEVRQALDALVTITKMKDARERGVVVDIEAKAQHSIDQMSDEQRQDAIRKLMWFTRVDDHLKALSEKPELLAVLQQMLGDTPHMFQDMALIKPPHIGREKPWHQDFAYFNLPLDTPVVGVWIALDEALVENGCMYVIPGTHRQGPVVHFQRRDWQICDTDVKVNDALAVPLKPGSCLFFDGLLHHGTPPSHSDKRRRALQYHYRPASAIPFPDSTQRLAVFGEEGKDVSC